MARLPVVGGDQDAWGTVLNDFLQVSHNNDGTLKQNPPQSISADDYASIALAIAAAISADLPLVFTKNSTYSIPTRIDVTGSLTIYGNGATINSTEGAFLIKDGCPYLFIQNLTLIGPNGLTSSNHHGIQWEAQTLSENKSYLHSLDLSLFHYGLSQLSGSGTEHAYLEIKDSCLHNCYLNHVSMFTGINQPKTLHMFNVRCETTASSHCCYVHPGVNKLIVGCYFDDTPDSKYGFQVNGTSPTLQGQYEQFIVCVFGPNLSRSMVTDHLNITILSGCTFHKIIQLGSSAVISGCLFKTEGKIEQYPNQNNQLIRNTIISGCLFDETDLGVDAEFIRVLGDGTQIYHLNITGNLFIAPSGGALTRYITIGGNGCSFEIIGNKFLNDVASDMITFQAGNSNTRCLIDSNQFIGDTPNHRGAVRVPGVDGGEKLIISNNILDAGVPRVAYSDADPDVYIPALGRNNHLHGTGWIDLV